MVKDTGKFHDGKVRNVSIHFIYCVLSSLFYIYFINQLFFSNLIFIS